LIFVYFVNKIIWQFCVLRQQLQTNENPHLFKKEKRSCQGFAT
jgi:hypothetical protein